MGSCRAPPEINEVSMHNFSMPPDIIERVIFRRGKQHAYPRLDAGKTALVVVDMQNGFLMPSVAHALCDTAREIVPNINRLAHALRSAGGSVAWILNTYTPETLDSWSHMHDFLTAPGRQEKRIAAMSRGSAGHQLWAELDVAEPDLKLEKYRYSAFIQGSSDLERQLRSRGIDTVLITGCATNVCCESTARDAMMLNFKTVMVSDGNAAANDEDHTRSLISFYLTFGDVLTTDEIIAGLMTA